MAVVVSDHQSGILPHNGSETVAHGFFQYGIVHGYIFITSLQGFDVNHVEHAYLEQIFIDFFIDTDLVVLDFIDDAVADNKEEFAVFFVDFPDLSTEQILTTNSLEEYYAVVFPLNLSEIVVATYPDLVVLSPIAHCDAGDARSADDAPFGMVVVHQSFEIGHKYRTILIDLDVEVHVVGMIIF